MKHSKNKKLACAVKHLNKKLDDYIGEYTVQVKMNNQIDPEKIKLDLDKMFASIK